jgi:hypothetical protein
MISLSQGEWLTMLRVTVVLQILASLWFLFVPDTLPSIIREAEMANDRPLYQVIDSAIVPIIYVQAILCLLLWWPRKFTALAYLGCVLLILVLGMFAGPAIVSDIDGVIGGVQALASGAMIMLLYQAGLFSTNSLFR